MSPSARPNHSPSPSAPAAAAPTASRSSAARREPRQGSRSSSRLRGADPLEVSTDPSDTHLSTPTLPLLDTLAEAEAAELIIPSIQSTSPIPTSPEAPQLAMSSQAKPLELDTPPHVDESDKIQRLLAKVPDVLKRAVTLDATGSNFNNWFDDIEDAIEAFLGKPLVFTTNMKLSTTDNIIIRSMLRQTIDEDEWSLHRREKYAVDIMASLTAKFFKNTRSSHLAIWKDLLSLKFERGDDNLHSHCARFSKLFSDLDRAGFVFSGASVAGVLLQLSLPGGEGPFKDISRSLDATGKVDIVFKDVMALATAELATFRLNRGSSPVRVAAAYHRRVMDSSPSPAATRPYSNYSTPSRPVRAIEAKTPYKTLAESNDAPCFYCLKPGHWADSCDRRAAGFPPVPRPDGFEFRSVGGIKKEWQLAPKSSTSPAAQVQTPPAPRPPAQATRSSLKFNAVDVTAQDADEESVEASTLLWDGGLTLDSAATES